MTTHTALRSLDRAMHRRKRLRHLIVQRHSRPGTMTITTIQLLPRGVCGMAELDLVSFAKSRHPLVSASLVAKIAGRQIASLFLSAKAVTLIAGRVRALPPGYGKRYAPVDRLMTRSTSGTGMARVTELHVEAPQPRKRFELGTLWFRARMTHRADRALHRGKLLRVAG
jgi:hypothetical protein